MATRTWIHIINTFEVNTRNSHRKMLTITSDTHSKLTAENSDTDIAAILADYDPVHQAYVQIYGQYDSATGIRKGNTLNLENMMTESLPTELRKWEGAVRNFYVEDSPQELAIFPNKRTPFLSGTYEERINAVNGLIGRLTEDGNFATLVTQVQSFYNSLLGARDMEQQKEGLVGQLSDLREQQRILLAEALDGFVLCMLKRKYRSDLQQVERFFDLSLLREINEPELLRTIENVAGDGATNNEGELEAEAKSAKITLLSNGPMQFGLSQDGATYIGTPIIISVPDTVEFDFEEVPAGTNLILVRNLNATEPSAYRIEIYG